MARLYNTFEFIGNVNIPKDKSKFHQVNESDSGWVGHRLNFAVQESKTNSVFLEMYGGYSKSKPNKVFSFSKGSENEKGTKLEIPWEDRLKPETVDMVADFKKIVIDLETDFELKEELKQLRFEIFNIERKDELTENDKIELARLTQEFQERAVHRKEFIHEYDAVNYLSEVLEEYTKHKFRITGRIEYNYYNGKFFRKFKPELIEIVEDDIRPKLRALYDVFFTKDSVDDADFKEEKKVYIDGYVLNYDSNAKKDQFFPQQFVINAQKLDFENELHVKRFEYFKNKFNVKGKGVYHLQWEVNIFRGADRVEFTIDDLTPQQREEVELGISKLESFAPKGGMLGETTEESRLVKPVLKEINKSNDFREGAVESTYEVDDLDFVPTERTASKQEKPKTETTKDESKSSDDIGVEVDLDDLFS